MGTIYYSLQHSSRSMTSYIARHRRSKSSDHQVYYIYRRYHRTRDWSGGGSKVSAGINSDCHIYIYIYTFMYIYRTAKQMFQNFALHRSRRSIRLSYRLSSSKFFRYISIAKCSRSLFTARQLWLSNPVRAPAADGRRKFESYTLAASLPSPLIGEICCNMRNMQIAIWRIIIFPTPVYYILCIDCCVIFIYTRACI